MKSVGQRLARLESAIVDRNRRDPNKSLRLVIRHIGRVVDNSTCKRTIAADGLLTEVVHLSGMRRSLSDAELETFIESFPIERA
jgi:hypothetical protein